MKTRNEAKPESHLSVKSNHSLPKIITKEIKVEGNGRYLPERQNHVFQVERFNEDQNVKITTIIKRFIPTETELAAIAISSKESM